MPIPTSTLYVYRLAPSNYDAGLAQPANIVVTVVAVGDRATAHAHRLSRHAESWLTTKFALDVDKCCEPLSEADVRGAVADADLVFLVSDTGARLNTGLTASVIGDSSDKCLHLDLERTAAELWQANADAGTRPMVSLGAKCSAEERNGSDLALSGVAEALLVGLFRHGIVGIDCADYLDAFAGRAWYAYAGFGRASGVKRSTVACDRAIADLEQQGANIGRSDIGVVVVALPEENGTLSEFEQVVSTFQARAPGATKLVAAPVGVPGAVEIALITAGTPEAGLIQIIHEVYE